MKLIRPDLRAKNRVGTIFCVNSVEQGYSLIELLIAISLALFLSAGVISIFIHSKATYYLTQQLTNIETNARSAFHALSWDIHMAGLIGCMRLADFSPLHTNLSLNSSLVVWHKGYTTAKMALPNLHRIQTNSDVILVQRLNPNTIPVSFAQGSQISLLKRAIFKPNNMVLISDCQHAEAFRWGQVKLSYNYLESELGFLDKIIYYIGDTGRISESGRPLYALYRRNLNKSSHKPIELVEGVERMSIRLGIKNLINGNLFYENADKVKQWSDVRSVEIKLLLTENKLLRQWKYIISLRERENRPVALQNVKASSSANGIFKLD